MSDALRDVTVFDGERVIGRFSVSLHGGTIGRLERVGSDAPASPHMVLPGFIDTHVHIGLTQPAEVLRRGVTTVRDLGWPARRVASIADDAARAATAGPSVLHAGYMLTALGGYPARAAWAPEGIAWEIETDGHARAAVNTLIDEHGAHTIKIAQEPRQGAVLSEEIVRVVCDTAHERGRRVASHCGALAELVKALDAGVDELAHGLWSDEPIPDQLIARMVAAEMIVIPTLHIDPSPARTENLRRFIAAGGSVVYGTDMGNPPAAHGIDVEELRLMQRAGMSVEKVLASATSEAARLLGLTDRGRIAEGLRADLILVEGDPRLDLGVLAQPVMVLRGGVAV